MADNVGLTPGSGILISTEEVSVLNGVGVSAQQVQRVGLARRSADGTAVDLSSSTSTITRIGGSVTTGTLKAANANRVLLIIVNDSTAILYVKYGATASPTDWTYKMQPDDSIREDIWTGRVDGIWVSATGAAQITELT